ncbi:MAG: hydrogenase nickel incorporation protein HypA/HybF [Thermoleophilaceae bacterium]|jgi:hydrogenase nickel incorporation protein HypA/HybF|nr:hydrogenase nickel incorporation protein HypA/HybF [Thermoleophilaceae bacterium]
MHELSLSGAIVNTAVKHADGRKVKLVSMRIGALRQVVPDSLDFYFDFVSKGTLCEGAALEYEMIPARLRCTDCSREWETDMPYFMCPDCGAAGHVEVATGDEFEVESIEVEEAECIAPR